MNDASRSLVSRRDGQILVSERIRRVVQLAEVIVSLGPGYLQSR